MHTLNKYIIKTWMDGWWGWSFSLPDKNQHWLVRFPVSVCWLVPFFDPHGVPSCPPHWNHWIFSINHEFKHHRGKSLFIQPISASETSTPHLLSPVFSHFLIHELVENNACDIWQEVEGKITETKKSTLTVRFGGKKKKNVEFVINGGFVHLRHKNEQNLSWCPSCIAGFYLRL